MNKIQWEGAQYLAKALSINVSLIDLSMSSGKTGGNNRNRILERGAYELSEALSENKFLLILNLTGNGIGSEGLSYLLPAIAQSNTIQSLNLSSNEIRPGAFRQNIRKDREMKGFSSHRVYLDKEFYSLKPLEHHKIENDDLKEKKRFKLQTAFLIRDFLLKIKSLKQFIFRANKIEDEGMIVIAEALQYSNSSIEMLDITQTSITADSFKQIVSAMKTNYNLHTLIADKNNLNTSYQFQQIRSIVATNSTTKVLSFAHCNLTDTFGVPFAEAIASNRALTRVNLYGNEMTDRTLSMLA